MVSGISVVWVGREARSEIEISATVSQPVQTMHQVGSNGEYQDEIRVGEKGKRKGETVKLT